MHTLKYSYLPGGQRDWIALYRELQEREAAEYEPDEPASPAFERSVVEARPLEHYRGHYRDPWFGDVAITVSETGLEFAAAKSPKLRGPLEHVTADTFVARWPDRSVGMDAWVRFEFDRDGKLDRMRMNRVFDSPDATIDYFEHLDLEPVEAAEGP